MKKKISDKKISSFESDIGIFLSVGIALGTSFGIVFGSVSGNIGLGISLGVPFGLCAGFVFTIIKNYEELAKKARSKR